MNEIKEENLETYNERPVKAAGAPRFRPGELPKGSYKYQVVKCLGAEDVDYVQNGKVMHGSPQRWIIKDDYGEKILSEWAFTTTFSGILTGHNIELVVNGSKKAILNVL